MMSDSQTAPITEQNSSSSEDFEFIEKEENGAFGMTTAKETTPREISDESPDLIPDILNENTEASVDSHPTDVITAKQDSELNILVGLETSDIGENPTTKESPTNIMETESLVIIDRSEPEVIPSENTENILPETEPSPPTEIPLSAPDIDNEIVDKEDDEIRDIFSQNLLDSPTTNEVENPIIDFIEKSEIPTHQHQNQQDELDISLPEKQIDKIGEPQESVITEPETNQYSETSNSTNVSCEDNPVVHEDITTIYTDRSNSPDPASEASTNYTYPVEQEFWNIEDIDDPQGSHARWKQVYMQLHMRSVEEPPPQRIARMQQNRPLNRYSNILANDATRIILTHPETDYINANFISVPEVDRTYIMTQGPLDITSEHFWHMIWQEQCPGIVMLNRTFESGKLKCYQYFPKDAGQQLVFGNFLIICQSQYDTDCYRMSNLELTHLPTQELRRITHFQYLSWPDFGAPQTPEDFLQFLVAVRDKGLLSMEVNGPPVVHCSAGVGRSGTFILVDACLRRIERDGHPLNVHVQDLILQMRQQRFGCIQSDEQLRFSYVAILVATHNIMSDLPIATVPELVERARQEAKVSPVPPKRTTSRVTKSELEIEPSEVEIVTERPPSPHIETSTTKQAEREPIIRERIRTENDPEIITTIEDSSNDSGSKFSVLKITLAVFAISVGIGLFYLLFL